LSRIPARAPALDVVLASANPGKLREFARLLGPGPLRLRSLSEFAPLRLPEEGLDYAENARAKAEAAAAACGLAALADDSGIEVEGLGGAPGPLSARYGGPGLDDAGRVRHLLRALARAPAGSRRARFVCVVALARPGAPTALARGECAGRILDAPRGAAGFGYDPIFAPAGESVSMAELASERKDEISHRGRALRALCDALFGAAAGARA